MENKTAVDLLHRESKEIICMFLDEQIDKRLLLTMHHNMFYPAKEVEKKQIMDSYKKGAYTTWGSDTDITEESQDYYNETFNY